MQVSNLFHVGIVFFCLDNYMNLYKPPANQWIFTDWEDGEYQSVSFKSGLRESSPQLRV